MPSHPSKRDAVLAGWPVYASVGCAVLLLWVAIMAAGCGDARKDAETLSAGSVPEKISIVTTTGMVRDMVLALVGPEADVRAIMGPGVDPHLYQPNRGDSVRLLHADVVVYNGLHLEGRLGEVLSRRTAANGPSIALGELLPQD